MTDLKNLNKAELAEQLASSLAGMADSKDKPQMQQLAHDLQTHQIELEMQNRELREAQSVLEDSRNRYANLYDFAPIGYLTLNSKGQVVEINLTGATMLGVERIHIIDQPLTRWLTPECRKTFLNHLNAVFNSKNKIVDELKTKSHNNEAIHDVQFESILSLGHEGNALCHTAMVDITERKQFEAQLILAKEEAKQRSQELSTEIAERKEMEKQLRRAHKMEALGQLTGGISHDFNNMLGVVTGYSELLKRALKEQPKLEKYAFEISHAAERGAKLTDKLLGFARKNALHVSPVNLTYLLQSEQDMLEKLLTPRIKLALDLADDLWTALINESEMEDAIINMSINAMHAIDGNGKLTIHTSNQQLNHQDATALGLVSGDYILLSFTDTGCGIDEATIDKIFDPFFTTKGRMGTGLGLSQVYGFVHSSGGEIKAYSKPEQGTQFVLYLPRHTKGDVNVKSIAKNNTADIKGTGTILLVDDEIELLNLNKKILAEYDFNVISADSAKKALEILEHEKIDLLITDIIMPEMDGYQLVMAVKEKYPNVIIQLVSGFTDDHNVDMVDEHLQQNILFKPFSPQSLLQRVRELLNE